MPLDGDQFADKAAAVRGNTEAAGLLRLIRERSQGEGDAYFVPTRMGQLDAYRLLEKLALVETIRKELRLSQGDRIKEGFIECRLSPEGLNLSEAIPLET